MKIHHIGYLVKRIDSAIGEFEKLGYRLHAPIVLDETRGAYICFMNNCGYCIELISPVNKQSPIYGLMDKHKNSPYHICYEAEDFEAAIHKLCNEGFMIFQSPSPAPAIGGNRVAFLVNADIGMIEVLEV